METKQDKHSINGYIDLNRSFALNNLQNVIQSICVNK